MISKAILGPGGTYSEEAARLCWDAQEEFIYAPTIGDVFDMVVKGQVEEGLVPVSNSSSGSIRATMYGLIEHDVYITGEVVLAISHCLMAREKFRIDEIELVISQPEAILQCEKNLAAMLPNARQEIVRSTAAAAMTARDEERIAVALGSKKAAAMYGMEVVAEKMEDENGNCTTFIKIGRRPSEIGEKTSIIFELKDYPGALYHALEPFARREINLSKLESRPRGSSGQSYVFYADIEGGITKPPIRAALEELNMQAAFFRNLGSY